MPNFRKVKKIADGYLAHATRLGLMFGDFTARKESTVTLGGRKVVSYTNCSYLGFDTDPAMVEAASEAVRKFGLHYCCARSRLSIAPLRELETELARLFGAPAITFPSLTATHAAILPLIASSTLLQSAPPGVHIVYDRFAHASMQVLREQLAQSASVATIEHNDLAQLECELNNAKRQGKACVYLADGIYSMGGQAPVAALLEMMRKQGLYLYLDDAHGTSVYGRQGEGFVASHVRAVTQRWPRRLFVGFSLAKGFGCNGGGIVVPGKAADAIVRRYAPNYLFSGPLDFAITGAALRGIVYHFDGTVATRQQVLRQRVAQFDRDWFHRDDIPFSPIRMIHVGSERAALRLGKALLERGHYVPVAFFPVVPRGDAQLRICITIQHTPTQLRKLCADVRELMGTLPRREAFPGPGMT